MKWPAREGLLLLGGLLFAFIVWVPVVINVLPRLAGRDPEPWRWGLEHLPEFFGSQGAGHAVMSWLMALLPYLLVQLGRVANWSVRTLRGRGGTPEVPGRRPEQVGGEGMEGS